MNISTAMRHTLVVFKSKIYIISNVDNLLLVSFRSNTDWTTFTVANIPCQQGRGTKTILQ